MDIQRDELLLREEARAAADAVIHPVQSRQAIDAIALEVVTHGIGVNLQDFRHFLCRPAGRKRHYHLDPAYRDVPHAVHPAASMTGCSPTWRLGYLIFQWTIWVSLTKESYESSIQHHPTCHFERSTIGTVRSDPAPGADAHHTERHR